MPYMFIPGPVNVAPEVLAAMARPVLSHRSKEFEALFRSTAERLQKLVATNSPVYQMSGSGFGMMEIGIRNFVSERLLCCVNGAYSQRWYDVAAACGKEADRIEMEDGEPILPGMLRDALKQRHYDAVTIIHNETSTGVMNPLADLAEVVREVSPDTLILVDAASSFGGVKIEMDAWGIDYLFTISQCCLALPPGLSITAVSPRALERAEKVSQRGWEHDILLWERHRLRDSAPEAPCIPLIYALDVQLNRILAEGIENRFARHSAMAERVQSWADEKRIITLARSPYRSRTVTALMNPGFSFEALNQFLNERGMCVANGYGRMRDRNFRIAHMGDTQPGEIETLLANIVEFQNR